MICFFINPYSRTAICSPILARLSAYRAAAHTLHGSRESTEVGDRKFLGAHGGGDASCCEQPFDRKPQRLETGAQHLAALAKGGGSNAFEHGLLGRSKRFGAREDVHDTRCHFGRRDKGSRRDIEQDPHLREPLNQHREPPVRLLARRCGKALGDLALEHQSKALIVADPLEPAEQQRRGDVVRQVRDDLAGCRREGCRIQPQRIAGNELQTPRIGGSQFAEGSKTAWVALDRNDPARAGGEQRAAQAARAGADLDDGGVVEPSGSARDPSRQVEIEEEILSETLMGDNAVPGDDLAQRRQWGGETVADQAAAARLAAIWAASRSAAIKLSARAVPRPAMSSAVP